MRQNPEGLLTLGDVASAPPLLAFLGFGVTAALIVRRVGGALLWGIGASTLTAMGLGLVEYQGVVAWPPSLAPTFLQMDLRAGWSAAAG